MTKADLADDLDEAPEVVDLYRGLGYPVLIGYAKDPVVRRQVRDLIARRDGARRALRRREVAADHGFTGVTPREVVARKRA